MAIAAALGACTDLPAPTAAGAGPSTSIADGANQGNAHFYFLPPLLQQPTYAGISDPDQQPVVVVCEWASDACGSIVAQFSRAGSGTGTITYDPAAELYHVNWHTDQCTTGSCSLDPAKTYRLRVLVGAHELGHADLDVVATGRELKNVQTGTYIGLVDGRTLPVNFRIEKGAVAVVPLGAAAKMAAAGGVLATADGMLAMKFPAGALAAETDITVKSAESIPPVGEWATPVDLGPDGTTFATPVTLTLGFNARKLPVGVTPDAMGLYTWMGSGWRLVEGSRVNETDNTVSAPISHFSAYTVAINPNFVEGNPPETLRAGGTTQLTGFVVSHKVAKKMYCYTVRDTDLKDPLDAPVKYEQACIEPAQEYKIASAGLITLWEPLISFGDPNIDPWYGRGFHQHDAVVGTDGTVVSPLLSTPSPGEILARMYMPGSTGYYEVAWEALIPVLVPVHSVTITPTTVRLSLPGCDPSDPDCAPGGYGLAATLRSAAGGELSGRIVTWTSSNPAVATVDDTGFVVAHAEGVATITATSEGVSGTATVNVGAPVHRITLTPSAALLSPPGPTTCDPFKDPTCTPGVNPTSQQFTATLWDKAGNKLEGRVITWAHANPAIASVDKTGFVTAHSIGTTTIKASSEGVGALATITVSYSAPEFVFTSAVISGNTCCIADIMVQRMDGTGTRKLTDTPLLHEDAPRWSHDGKRIAYWREGNVYVIDAESGAQAWSTTDNVSRHPSFSPLGKYVAYTRNYLISLMNPDNGAFIRTLSSQPGGNPVWSPDEGTIAFEGGIGFGYEIFLVDVNGGPTRQLTALGGFNTNPGWSPDGRKIVFAHQRSIYLIDMTSAQIPITSVAQMTQLTSTGRDYAPSWSADGSQIIFASERHGQFEILVMNADGTDVRNLTNTLGHAESMPSLRPPPR